MDPHAFSRRQLRRPHRHMAGRGRASQARRLDGHGAGGALVHRQSTGTAVSEGRPAHRRDRALAARRGIGAIPHAAGRAVRCRGVRPADRLRQSRQPAAGPGSLAAAGIGRAHRNRRRPGAAGAAALDGVSAAGLARRLARRAAGGFQRPAARQAGAELPAHRRDTLGRFPRPRLRRADHRAHRRGFRDRARLEGLRRRPGCPARRSAVRWRPQGAPAIRPGDRRGGGLGRAADLFRAAGAGALADPLQSTPASAPKES